MIMVSFVYRVTLQNHCKIKEFVYILGKLVQSFTANSILYKHYVRYTTFANDLIDVELNPYSTSGFCFPSDIFRFTSLYFHTALSLLKWITYQPHPPICSSLFSYETLSAMCNEEVSNDYKLSITFQHVHMGNMNLNRFLWTTM